MFQVPGLAERLLTRDRQAMMARTLLGAAGKRSALGKRDIEAYTTALHREGVLACALGYYRAIPKSFSQSAALARPITCPVLVLWGKRDPALGSFLATDAKPWCANEFTVQWFPEAGHWLQREEAQAVSAALVGFAG